MCLRVLWLLNGKDNHKNQSEFYSKWPNIMLHLSYFSTKLTHWEAKEKKEKINQIESKYKFIQSENIIISSNGWSRKQRKLTKQIRYRLSRNKSALGSRLSIKKKIIKKNLYSITNRNGQKGTGQDKLKEFKNGRRTGFRFCGAKD